MMMKPNRDYLQYVCKKVLNGRKAEEELVARMYELDCKTLVFGDRDEPRTVFVWNDDGTLDVYQGVVDVG